MIVHSEHVKKKSKLYFSHGFLPKYVDREQLPARDKPWCALFQQRWASTVEMILDESLYDQISPQLSKLGKTSWSRVVLPLSALLQGDFFEAYLKKGNVSMLSQGRAGLDPIYSLYEGVLRLELPKELYERAGLVGYAVSDGGRKHIKTRFAVDINLRQPSMVRGKKGFERVVWAFKNVMCEPVTWLFYDHWQSKMLEGGTIPLSLHDPIHKELSPSITRLTDVLVPDMRSWSEDPERNTDDAVALLDWLGMVGLDSPRVYTADSIDPFLARYEVPERERASSANVVKLKWNGFIQAEWVRQLLLQCMTATQTKSDVWYAITARTLFKDSNEPRDGYTVLRTQLKDTKQPTNTLIRPEFVMWEMVSCTNP